MFEIFRKRKFDKGFEKFINHKCPHCYKYPREHKPDELWHHYGLSFSLWYVERGMFMDRKQNPMLFSEDES